MGEHKKLKITFLISVFFLVTAGLIYYLVVFPKTDKFTYELGTEISTDISDYLFGSSFSISEGSVDLSQVDVSKAGEYEATVTNKGKTYTYEIIIVDTVAPTLELDSSIQAIALNKQYEAKDLIANVSDASNSVETGFIIAGEKSSTFIEDEPKDLSLTIYAVDPSGNETDEKIAVKAAYSPVIVGVRNFLLTEDETVTDDLALSNIYVYDKNTDEVTTDVTYEVTSEKITINDGYVITYTATNDYGLTATAQAETIEVDEEPDLDTEMDLYYSEDNMNSYSSYIDEIIDAFVKQGIYDFSPNEDENVEETKALIRPSLVSLRHYYGDGSYVFGSGVIYKIDSDYTYILSVNHVLTDVDESCTIEFCDGATLAETFTYVTESSTNEVGMFKIPTRDIPMGTIFAIKEACFDTSVYDTIY